MNTIGWQHAKVKSTKRNPPQKSVPKCHNAKGYTFKIWKSYHIDICQPKFGLYSWMDRAKKTINFRLWNFCKSPFQAKDMAHWISTPICYQYQLLMVIAWLPDLLLTWVPYQGMEQTKLLILGFEIWKLKLGELEKFKIFPVWSTQKLFVFTQKNQRNKGSKLATLIQQDQKDL